MREKEIFVYVRSCICYRRARRIDLFPHLIKIYLSSGPSETAIMSNTLAFIESINFSERNRRSFGSIRGSTFRSTSLLRYLTNCSYGIYEMTKKKYGTSHKLGYKLRQHTNCVISLLILIHSLFSDYLHKYVKIDNCRLGSFSYLA